VLAMSAADISRSLTALHFDDNAEVPIAQLHSLAVFTGLRTLSLARTTSDTSADVSLAAKAVDMPLITARSQSVSHCAIDSIGSVAAAAASLRSLRNLERVVLTHGDAYGEAAAAALARLPASRCRVTTVGGPPQRLGCEAAMCIRPPWPPAWLVGWLDHKVLSHSGNGSGGVGGAVSGSTIQVLGGLHSAVTL
jgi:hypothetical protein